MKINLDTNDIVLEEGERGALLAAAHPTKLSTMQLLNRLVATYSANFEQDLHDILKED